ncbi:MAG: hypothetical protein EHV01_003080 [Spiroplasma sp. hy2]|uniref:hypothetical protein n=1 Tax=Spiroplasma sp. hy2 TaxID=2490850 RepID=UPI00383CE832
MEEELNKEKQEFVELKEEFDNLELVFIEEKFKYLLVLEEENFHNTDHLKHKKEKFDKVWLEHRRCI